jgi:tRNA A37 threonylcarbamoyladenosine dehydratase
VEVDDLAEVTHDPLLASLRQRLRQRRAAPRQGAWACAACFRARAWLRPPTACDAGDGTLNCHGYGSSVAVTATFGMVAAGEAIATAEATKPLG